MRRAAGRLAALAALAAAIATGSPAFAQDACDLPTDCALPRAQGVQLCPFDRLLTIHLAANDALGHDGPGLPPVRRGCAAGVDVPGRVPCQLLRAIAWAKSGWRQFCGEGCGGDGTRGLTRMSAACGVGLMAVPEDDPPAGVELARLANSMRYNAGAGALRLAEAWGVTPCVGDADPDVAEHWYFAVWAADAFTYANNPNNPAYPVLRGTYGGVDGLDRDSYPFQETVFGLAGHPPRVDGDLLWEPAPVNLPDSGSVCGTAGCLPGNVPSPRETHDRDCPQFVPPEDGGLPDAGTDDGGVADGGTDAGSIDPDPRVTGCDCRVGGGGGAGGIVWLLAITGVTLRARRGRGLVRSGPARRSR